MGRTMSGLKRAGELDILDTSQEGRGRMNGPDDINEVMKQESRRGRRPVDLQARRKRLERLAEMRKVLTVATETEFRAAMRAFGIREGSQQYAEALEAWREFQP